jgi:hypothetical protein
MARCGIGYRDHYVSEVALQMGGGLNAGGGPSACQCSVFSQQCTCLCPDRGVGLLARLWVGREVELVFRQDGV